MVTNAQMATKGAIMLLTNFVFISVIFLLVLALFGFPPVGGHFGPFTDVVRKIRREVTRKVGRRRNFEAYAVASNSRMARRVP